MVAKTRYLLIAGLLFSINLPAQNQQADLNNDAMCAMISTLDKTQLNELLSNSKAKTFDKNFAEIFMIKTAISLAISKCSADEKEGFDKILLFALVSSFAETLVCRAGPWPKVETSKDFFTYLALKLLAGSAAYGCLTCVKGKEETGKLLNDIHASTLLFITSNLLTFMGRLKKHAANEKRAKELLNSSAQ